MKARTAFISLLAGPLLLVLPPAAGPVRAHTGAAAQLYVAAATITPQGQGWVVSAALRDLDSGAPQPGFAVQIQGAGPSSAGFGPISLADPDGAGRYQAQLPALSDGSWEITVKATEVPGGTPALPYRRTWHVALRAGQPIDLAGRASGTGGDNGGSVLIPVALGVAGAITLIALIASALGWRRRGMVAAR